MVIDPGAQDSNRAALDGQVGAPVGAPTWLSPRVLADLVHRCRRTEQMSAMEVSLICYLDRLEGGTARGRLRRRHRLASQLLRLC